MHSHYLTNVLGKKFLIVYTPFYTEISENVHHQSDNLRLERGCTLLTSSFLVISTLNLKDPFPGFKMVDRII